MCVAKQAAPPDVVWRHVPFITAAYRGSSAHATVDWAPGGRRYLGWSKMTSSSLVTTVSQWTPLQLLSGRFHIYIYIRIYILINQFVYLFIYLFVTYIHTTIWYSIIQHAQRNIQQIQHRMHMPFTDTIALWENSLIDAPWGPCRRAWARPRCCPLCCGFAMPPGEAPFHLGMVYMIYLWWCGKMCVFFFSIISLVDDDFFVLFWRNIIS